MSLGKKDIFLIFAFIAVVLQSQAFLFGYRNSADDIEGHYYLLKGVGSLFAYAKDTAEISGRVGHLILIPVGAVASYLSGFLIFRVFSVWIYYLILFLSAKYISTMLRRDVALFVWIVMISLVPLDWLHFPPNAFPQFLWPIILILILKHALWKISISPYVDGILSQGMAFVVLLITMLSTEYAVILFVALSFIEFSARVKWKIGAQHNCWEAIRMEFKSASFIYDSSLLAISLAVYVMYRRNHPSQYSGVMAGGVSNLVDVVRTTVGHIYAGLSLARLASVKTIWNQFFTLGSWPFLLAIISGSLSAVVSWYSLSLKIDKTLPLSSVIVACGFSVFVTLPLAISTQYQNWCLDWFAVSCGYLDSRISYLGISAALALLILRLSLLFTKRTLIFLFKLIISLLLGLCAIFTYANNSVLAHAMEERSRAWTIADLLACKPELLKPREQDSVKIIDNNGLIAYHPRFPVNDYWNIYMLDRVKYLDCTELMNLYPKLLEDLRYNADIFIPVGENIDFEGFHNRKFLKAGWSYSEKDGVWSDSEKSTVFGYVNSESAYLYLIISGQALPTSKANAKYIDIFVNKQVLGRIPLSANDLEQTFKIMVPANLIVKNEGAVEIDFKFSNLKSPKELGISEDPRHLGFKLKSISLIEVK